MNCPQCKNEMMSGYSAASSSLSWIEAERFLRFAFMDEDLAKAGLRTLFPWKGEYFRAFNCTECKIVLVDYSEKVDRKTIKSNRGEGPGNVK